MVGYCQVWTCGRALLEMSERGELPYPWQGKVTWTMMNEKQSTWNRASLTWWQTSHCLWRINLTFEVGQFVSRKCLILALYVHRLSFAQLVRAKAALINELQSNYLPSPLTHLYTITQQMLNRDQLKTLCWNTAGAIWNCPLYGYTFRVTLKISLFNFLFKIKSSHWKEILI